MDDCIYITDDENIQEDGDVEIVKTVESKHEDSFPVIIATVNLATEPQPPASWPRHLRNHPRKKTRSQPPPAPHVATPSTIHIRESTPTPPTPITIQPSPPPQPAPPSPRGPKCTICLTAFATRKEEGFKIIITKCGHLFCDTCINGSMKALGRRCPKCRKAISPREKFIEVFDL